MIMLAIKSSKYREMSFIEKKNLELLQALAQIELYEMSTLETSSKSFGLHAPGSPNQRHSNT